MVSLLTRIAIIGGGIGGLMTAVTLRQIGCEVTVLERMATYEPLGALIEIGPNAVRLMDEVGLGAVSRANGVRHIADRLLRWQDGSLIVETPLGSAAEEHFGAPGLAFRRSEFVKLLRALLPDECVKMSSPVVDIQQDDGTATVVLKGGERLEVDAVVVSDGIKSRIRSRLFGPDRPIYSGVTVYWGLMPLAEFPTIAKEAPIKRYWLGPGASGVCYRGTRHLSVIFAIERPEEAAESWTATTDVQEVLRYITGWDPLYRSLFEGVTNPLRAAIYMRPQVDRWVKHRACLLGDSAHAMVPFQAQGASQAIEDAYVLAHFLKDADKRSVPARLLAYERVRLGRANAVHSISKASMTNVYHLPDGPEQRARDTMLRESMASRPFGMRQPLYEYDVRAELV